MSLPFDPHLFQLYLVAVIVLILIPGPDFLLVLGRSLFDGRRAGWTAIGGITLGNTIHSTLAAAGISALVAASPALFQGLKLLGAVYLAWLGLRALAAARRHWREHGTLELRAAPDSARRIFTQALVTNLLNAKVILFYLAFVPQFVAPQLGHVAVQTFVMGMMIAVVGGLYLAAIAAFAAGTASRIAGNRWFRTGVEGLSGLIFIGFALRLFFTERKLV
ncbi:LysE family translocator [Zavarzinia compransoris]|uniref:LysE family translocator n=1 Tax=Zavarzinia compransoris TaxID=1264899 RepID=A0A317DY16_9PROT|nr:LysE family translocator [Zavarzinia compransoris]PWR18830.1 LysE family translocator [Zavarzinia compransoris]TDP48818.1 threonine/homoserine/homoserine lactone efflux protein [Zavarzinia compransoris]